MILSKVEVSSRSVASVHVHIEMIVLIVILSLHFFNCMLSDEDVYSPLSDLHHQNSMGIRPSETERID